MQKTSNSLFRRSWRIVLRSLWRAAIGVWASRGGRRTVPREVVDGEIILRAVLSPYHVKGSKLLPAAFRSPPDIDEVSVSRGRYVAVALAKCWAKAFVQRRDLTPAKDYVGIAFLRAADVRRLGSQVVDSRNEYLGHADIQHGVVQQRGQALPAAVRKSLDDRLKEMARTAKYAPDPDPSGWKWKGDYPIS